MPLAYLLAVRNRIKNQFCRRNKKAERKWLKNFLCRHPKISVSHNFLALQKDGREGFAGIQLRLTLHQIWTMT
jgi:hypothetical protein